MKDISYIRLAVPSKIYFQFKNKCKFYEITNQEVISLAMEKFLDGDYDEELGIEEVSDKHSNVSG